MPVNADPLELHMLSLINEERDARGLNPLELETNLNMSAEEHSQWMLDTNVFSHTGAGGSSATDRIEAELDLTGSWRTAENIAIQSIRGEPGLLDDVENLHESLMNSPGHRANILNPDLEYIGLGIELGDFTYSSGGTFQSLIATQNFATTAAEVDVDPGTSSTPLEMPDPVPSPDPELSEPDPEPPMQDEPEDIPVAEAPEPAPTDPESTGDEEENETPVAEAPEPSDPVDPTGGDTPVAVAPEPTPATPDDMGEDEEDGVPVAEAPEPTPSVPTPSDPQTEDVPGEDVYACPFPIDDLEGTPLRSTARFEFTDDVFEFRDAETVFGDVSMGDFVNRILTQASDFAERQNQEVETFEFAFSFDLRPNDPASGQLSGRESLNEFDVDFAAFEAPVEQSIDLFS